MDWEELIKGVRNNKQGLTKKAEIFAQAHLLSCSVVWDELFKILEKDKSIRKEAKLENQFEIFYEYIFLFLHLTDRASFNLLGARKRKVFMDVLVIKLDKALIGSSLNPEVSEGLYWMEVYNSRQREYSKCRMPLKEEKSYKGDIFWEFGKKIANILGRPKDMGIIMPAYLSAAHTFFSLNLEGLLEEN